MIRALCSLLCAVMVSATIAACTMAMIDRINANTAALNAASAAQADRLPSGKDEIAALIGKLTIPPARHAARTRTVAERE